MPDSKRRITAEDLYRFQLVSDPQLSPDGRFAAFLVIRVDEKTEKKYSNLWLIDTRDNRQHQYTYGDWNDSQPRWSPDGQSIAFLSNRKDEKQAQLYIIQRNGGEARPVTDIDGRIGAFEWSPDGTTFVCQYRKKDEAVSEREKDEQKKKLGVVAHHITRTTYKGDGVGYLPEERWHIWTIDAASGETTQLTAGDYNEVDPHWSPDGSQILFSSNRAADPDIELDAVSFYLLPATGGEEKEIITRYARKFLPSFSPDGQHIAYLGREQQGHWYQNASLYVVPTSGGESRHITAGSDLHLSLITNTDVGSGTAQPAPIWSADGQTIYSIVTSKGNQPLVAFDVVTQNISPVIDKPGLVGSLSFDQSRRQFVYLWGEIDKPGQLWFHDLDNGQSRQLTHCNEDWLAELDLGRVEEVTFSSADGTQLDGWITFPPDFDPTAKYPSIMEIHGGPQTQYGRSFMHEFYYLAAQDYIVYWSNPRGSQGYGNDFAGAIYGQWGTVDYADVMAWADYMEQKPYIDSTRMGVTGGSYGGYMTTLLVGKTHRFQAAVSQRMVSNAISFYGSSDMNWGAENLFGLEGGPWDHFDQYWEMSPVKYIGNAQTPLLIIHSQGDYRCDQEQSEQIYVALRRRGIDTEMVLFPDEPHGLSRVGRTDRRIARLNHILRWFETYLKK